MGIKSVRRREYRGPELDGNVFEWLIEESERIRYWSGRETREPIPYRPPLKSLRGNYQGHTVLRLDADESSADRPRENTFEISKARKL